MYDGPLHVSDMIRKISVQDEWSEQCVRTMIVIHHDKTRELEHLACTSVRKYTDMSDQDLIRVRDLSIQMEGHCSKSSRSVRHCCRGKTLRERWETRKHYGNFEGLYVRTEQIDLNINALNRGPRILNIINR